MWGNDSPYWHLKDFPSSHLLNLAFVDLLLPPIPIRKSSSRAHLAVGKIAKGKFLVPVILIV